MIEKPSPPMPFVWSKMTARLPAATAITSCRGPAVAKRGETALRGQKKRRGCYAISRERRVRHPPAASCMFSGQQLRTQKPTRDRMTGGFGDAMRVPDYRPAICAAPMRRSRVTG